MENLDNNFYFVINSSGLTQPIIRWFCQQSRVKFFSKFFMIVDYYHKTCCYIQEINNNYPKVFTNTLIMFLNLGENIIYILNILLQTYIKDIKTIEFINF